MDDTISQTTNQKAVIPALAGVVGLGTGFLIGYFVARRKVKQLEVENNQLCLAMREHENSSVSFDEQLESDDIPEFTPEERARVEAGGRRLLETILREPSHGDVVNPRHNPAEIELVEPARVVNIFARDKPDTWDYEVERTVRTAEGPYIIHRDEFFADEMGFDQSTLTYYAGDDVLCDEADTVMYRPQDIVGELHFGHGSEDKNIVYVRNESLRHEWEIIRDSGHYQVEVLGLEIENKMAEDELRHSRSPRKFRQE